MLGTEIKLSMVALVHDYLFEQGGAENVVEAMGEIYPDAPIYTSIYNPQVMSSFYRERTIKTSFLQAIGQNKRFAKSLLPLYPVAFRRFDFSGYQVVLSSTTSFAKWIRPAPEVCHICFCHNPTRFLWTPEQYLEPYSQKIYYPLLQAVINKLKYGDWLAAQQVDFFIANSKTVQKRIRQFYGREAVVINSPINCADYAVGSGDGDFFLIVSRMLPYKRIDLAIEACNRLGKPLYIAGDGPERLRLEAMAGPTIRFLGRVSDAEKRELLGRCQALILPGEEDFGLTPLEAMASGRPVIAYRGGGALETVLEGVTGQFFDNPQVADLMTVLERFDGAKYQSHTLRHHAEQFDVKQFQAKIKLFVQEKYEEKYEKQYYDGEKRESVENNGTEKNFTLSA